MKAIPQLFRYTARLLVGVLFLFSSVGKLANVEAFGNLIVSYGFNWTSILAPGIAVLELMLGLALVLDLFPRITVPVTLGMLVLFTGAFFYGNVVNGIEDCGCFGNLEFMQMPVWVTYTRNALLLGLLVVGWEPHSWEPAKASPWALGVFAIGTAVALFFSGFTFQLPQFYQSRVNRQHPLLNLDVAQTPLPQFIQTSPDSTYTLYVFSYSCVSCINGLPALLEYQDPAICDRVIGLAVNEDKDNAIHNYYHIPFDVVPVGNALGHFTHTVPTLLYIENNQIKFVVEGGAPSSWWFRKAYLENL